MERDYIHPISIGALQLKNNILVAPLAGVSDYPFRHMATLFGPGLVTTEMVKMDGLVRLDPASFRMLDYSSSMHPIAAQLCGSSATYAPIAAKIVEDMGFDCVDLNCGCPVDKVLDDGSGSGLMKTPFLMGEILSNMVNAVRIPVTVKIRTGWDEGSIIVADLVRMAELAGVKLITVHGRTRKQGYSGKVHLEWIKAAVDASKHIPVIGNGDIFCAQDAADMFEATGCSGVMVARGMLSQPWLVEDIKSLCEHGEVIPKTLQERRQLLMEFFAVTTSFCSKHRATVELKRVCCSYISKEKNARHFREAFSRATSLAEIRSLIDDVYTQRD